MASAAQNELWKPFLKTTEPSDIGKARRSMWYIRLPAEQCSTAACFLSGNKKKMCACVCGRDLALGKLHRCFSCFIMCPLLLRDSVEHIVSFVSTSRYAFRVLMVSLGSCPISDKRSRCGSVPLPRPPPPHTHTLLTALINYSCWFKFYSDACQSIQHPFKVFLFLMETVTLLQQHRTELL